MFQIIPKVVVIQDNTFFQQNLKASESLDLIASLLGSSAYLPESYHIAFVNSLDPVIEFEKVFLLDRFKGYGSESEIEAAGKALSLSLYLCVSF